MKNCKVNEIRPMTMNNCKVNEIGLTPVNCSTINEINRGLENTTLSWSKIQILTFIVRYTCAHFCK